MAVPDVDVICHLSLFPQGLLAREPSTRLDVSSMLSSPYFHTGGVALLCAIDTIQERDVPSQASFLSSLPAQLHMFEARILKYVPHSHSPKVASCHLALTLLVLSRQAHNPPDRLPRLLAQPLAVGLRPGCRRSHDGRLDERRIPEGRSALLHQGVDRTFA